ncbi:hypothetical protein F652_627 [Enterobacteriaceae bacterium bta3-1]|nr:hypothetical protein F652_627 [Enterobacteriaceae bacterium bta3-1]
MGVHSAGAVYFYFGAFLLFLSKKYSLKYNRSRFPYGYRFVEH